MRDDCMEWPGTRISKGYGSVFSRVTKRPVYMHRVVYEAAFGPIPDGMCVRHKCDNPPCCNPNHLEVGTHADNMRDMAERGRSCKALTGAQEREIRERHAAGESFDSMADDYGVSSVTIGSVCSDIQPGRGAHVKKLTWEQREYAIDKYRRGFPVFVIADELGVTDGAIYYHIRRAASDTSHD